MKKIMGLESNIKRVIDGKRRTQNILFQLVDTKAGLRLVTKTTFDRNEIFKVLKASDEFYPKKIGKYRITFRPISERD